METPHFHPEVSGNGQPPFNRVTVGGGLIEPNKADRAMTLIRQMDATELRELKEKYLSQIVIRNPEKEAFDRVFNQTIEELTEHWDPEAKGFKYDSHEYEGYYTYYDYEEIYGRFFYHSKDEKPYQLSYMFEYNAKLLKYLKSLGWEEADEIDPTAIY